MALRYCDPFISEENLLSFFIKVKFFFEFFTEKFIKVIDAKNLGG